MLDSFIFVILQSQTASQRPGHGQCGWVADIMESVYLTLFLDSQKLRNFLISVKDEADGGCPVDM